MKKIEKLTFEKLTFDQLDPEAKEYAIKNEIIFQILTETRPDAIAYAGNVVQLFATKKAFFEDCCRQDIFNSKGVIIKP